MMVLSSALESLPENMRQILNLAGMENLSYEQIADILDVPLGTVRSRLSRAARRCAAHGSARGRAALLKRLRGPGLARSSRAAIPGRVPIRPDESRDAPAGGLDGRAAGWRRRPATGSATVDPAPGAPGWPVARHRWRARRAMTAPRRRTADPGSRRACHRRLASHCRPVSAQGTGRPTPPVFIIHGAATASPNEGFATVTIFAGAATVTPLMDTSLGRIRNSRSRRCTVLDLLENKAPGTECRQAAARCRPSRYSGCCCTRLSAGSADPRRPAC